MIRRAALVGALALVTACGGARPAGEAGVVTPTARAARGHGHANGHGRGDGHGHGEGHGRGAGHGRAAGDPAERKLDEVAAVHGAAGPWAVAGYRMSEHALAKLGLERGSFDLEIVHWTPKEVRYSCIADGAAAHSGASLGKLNLSLVDTTADKVLTIYRDKKTGRSVALRPAASFRERYADTPRDRARELGREVLGLPADQVFEEIAVK